MSIVVQLGEVSGSVPLYGSHIGLNSIDIGSALDFTLDQTMYVQCIGLQHETTNEIISMVVSNDIPDATVVPRNEMSKLKARETYNLLITGTFVNYWLIDRY